MKSWILDPGSWILAAALVAMGTTAQSALAASDAAAKFGAREDVQQISLSPDGKSIAFIGSGNGRGSAVMVINIADGTSKGILASTGEPDRLRSCRWSTNARLVCDIYMIVSSDVGEVGFTRMIAIDSDGKNLKSISAREPDRGLRMSTHGGSVIDWSADDAGGTVLMTRDYIPE